MREYRTDIGKLQSQWFSLKINKGVAGKCMLCKHEVKGRP